MFPQRGALPPAEGRAVFSAGRPNVRWAKLSTQVREKPLSVRTRPLGEALTGAPRGHADIRGQSRHVVGYIWDFLFASGTGGERPPGPVLSGGERGPP